MVFPEFPAIQVIVATRVIQVIAVLASRDIQEKEFLVTQEWALLATRE